MYPQISCPAAVYKGNVPSLSIFFILKWSEESCGLHKLRSVGCSFPSVRKENMTVISINIIFSLFLIVLLTIFMIIHIKYVKPALTRGLTVHDLEAPGQVPTSPSPKSDPGCKTISYVA